MYLIVRGPRHYGNNLRRERVYGREIVKAYGVVVSGTLKLIFDLGIAIHRCFQHPCNTSDASSCFRVKVPSNKNDLLRN